MTFTGQLNSNEIFSAIYNMIISQEVFADNLSGADSALVDRARVDGSMLGDTKLYYATDALKSAAWGNDAEAANLLALHRPSAPSVQALEINVFRQICLTIDNYMTKRAFSDFNSFSQFNSVMMSWLRGTKQIYDITTYNVAFGTEKTNTGNQEIIISLPEQALGVYYDTTEEEFLEGGSDLEKTARLEAQKIAQTIADVFVGLKDVTRAYNDYGYIRSFKKEDIAIVWNSAWVNKLTKLDLPTIFNKDIMESMSDTLPARYFGTKVAVTGSAITADGLTHRSLVEQDVTVSGTTTHLFAGDLIPQGASIASTTKILIPAYVEDGNVICKMVYKKNNSMPYQSGFEVGTSFFNPKALVETNYLTFGHNTLEHLKNYPFITISAS